jgi:hypothetical protein
MRNHKKQKMIKKLRVPIVTIGFDKDVEISSINVDKNRQLVFKDSLGNLLEPSSVTVGDAYLRPSKPKVLRQLQSESSNIRLNTKWLLGNQDATSVIDTNYRDLGDFRLCVSASTLILYDVRDMKRMANCYLQSSLVFCTSSTENPERFGWWDIIERFIRSPYYEINKSYGIVVDSDLADLSRINMRTVPVWRENYLPNGFQILYASADCGQESYINKEIRRCDKRSKRILSQIISAINLVDIRRNLQQIDYLKLCYVNIRDEFKKK